MLFDIRIRPLLFGLASRVPGMTTLFRRGTGGTSSARYCYSVWLRHLVSGYQAGITSLPRSVGELGPGDSLGTGFAALLSGAERYYAFDVVRHAAHHDNLAIYDELVQLFAERSDIPNGVEFPLIRPLLANYEFPSQLLTEAHLEKTLAPERVAAIRTAITSMSDAAGPVQYVAPWLDGSLVRAADVDMIFSQAVLEHVDELEQAYEVMRAWLRPTGHMSHTIDFCSHGITKSWSGHWAQSDLLWKILRGRKAYMINREPHSTHVRLLEKNGFSLLSDIRYEKDQSTPRKSLAPRFTHALDSDLITSEAYIVARPASP